jgi:hypothetical protein
MVKIKLEQWKEVIRLEVIENTNENRIVFEHNNIKLIIYNGCETHISVPEVFIGRGTDIRQFDYPEEIIKEIKKAIEEYNSSIPDDGYKWACDACTLSCKWKCSDDLRCPNSSGLLPCIEGVKPNWQPINNNKIEIIEDKEGEQDD